MTNTFSQKQNQTAKEKSKQEYLDTAASLQVAFIIDAHPNTCFDNVLDMFIKYLPDVFFLTGGTFIEGWYVVDLEDEVVVNEHGWSELLDGRKIIDPTIVRLVPPERSVYYFPGVERSWQEVNGIIQKRDVWFPYVRCVGTYGEDGLGHPAYKAAHDAAMRKVFELAHATQPPKKKTFMTAQDDQQDREISVQIVIVSVDQNQEE